MRIRLATALATFGLVSACATAGDDHPGETDGLIGVPGSPVKIARIDDVTYSISLDGMQFSAPRTTTFRLTMPRNTFDPVISQPAALKGIDDRQGQLYLVQFITPPLEAMRTHLGQLGARVHGYFPSNALVVRMTPGTASVVAGQPYVRWVGSFRPSYRIAPDLLTATAPVRVYVRAIEMADKTAIADRIRGLGGTLHAGSITSPLIEATLTPSAILELVTRDDVEFIDRWQAPEADMDIAREISGSNFIEGVAGFTGQGVRAEVMDGNVLETHGDFQSRPLILHGTKSGDDSHGTPTSGIVFGDGTGNPQGRGVLPSGQGIFASYETMTDRYAHTGELVQAPYFAVFQSNSWGGGRTTEYTNVSAEMDRLTFDHDILILQSQSNAGDRQSRPEAWAKNVLSIGGFLHRNTLDPSDDIWAGTASIGPATDGRIKPDLAHFYDATFAPASFGNYGDFGGTSGATPITAGHAGVFFQMWADGTFGDPGPGTTVFERRPHMTTSKAILINSASRYAFEGESHDMTRVHQGWGRIDIKKLYELRNKLLIINETDVLAPLAVSRHQVEVAAGEPELLVTMVFADPPGTPAAARNRVNDLTLRVVSPSGVEYFGNNGLRVGNESIPGGSPDVIDTVENVFLRTPEAGVWTIEVRADEVNQDGHKETPELDVDYALVASGVNGAPAQTGLSHPILSQVGYDTPGDDAQEEWVQVYNPTTATLDLSGWTLTDNAGTYALPAGTTLAAGRHLTVARSSAGFTALFGVAPDVADMTLQLGNSGDQLKLSNPAGQEIDFVAWESTAAGWPIAATTGRSIERADLTVDPGTVADWRAASPAKPRTP